MPEQLFDMKYLYLAYVIVWIALAGYLYYLHRKVGEIVKINKKSVSEISKKNNIGGNYGD